MSDMTRFPTKDLLRAPTRGLGDFFKSVTSNGRLPRKSCFRERSAAVLNPAIGIRARIANGASSSDASEQTRVAKLGTASPRPSRSPNSGRSYRSRFAVGGVITTVLCGLLLTLPGHSVAQQPVPKQPTVESSGQILIDAKTQLAIDRGLAYLAASQNADGSFGRAGMYRKNVAVTSLAGMAFLSAGHTPGRGKYGANVSRAVEFILSRSGAGFITSPGPEAHGPMYGHGFATLFLAEIYGMTAGSGLDQRVSVADALESAVKLIINSQNKDGGWRYRPDGKEADVSVTVCQIMALRAARNAGIEVPKTVVDRCTEYVKKCPNRDGGFRYQLRAQRESKFPRTAACVVAMYSAGIYDGPEVTNGLKYMLARRPDRVRLRFQAHYFYGHYYAVLAMWHAGGRYWDQWFPAIRDDLLERQNGRAGYWSGASINSEYATAMACLILQMPNNYLPIFQR